MGQKLRVVTLFTVLLLWPALAAFPEEPENPRVSGSRNEYLRPPAVPFPDDNPYSAAKVEIGRMLFFDPLLSGSGSRSCASCHNPSLSWGDGLARAVGDTRTVMPLRAPTLLDVAWIPRLGWDGKFRDIEAVTFAAITGVQNMDLPEVEAIKRVSANPVYAQAFATAFQDGGVTRRNIELALASYERTIVSGEAPFDRWVSGDESAIGEAAKRGFALFGGRAHCSACHSSWTFTDGSFHDIGTAHGDDIGRGRFFPTSVKLGYAFKVPTLRDVARRAPYMHDGSIPTLAQVLELYNQGGIERPSRSALIGPLGLTEDDKADLIAFLHALTSLPQPISLPILPR